MSIYSSTALRFLLFRFIYSVVLVNTDPYCISQALCGAHKLLIGTNDFGLACM